MTTRFGEWPLGRAIVMPGRFTGIPAHLGNWAQTGAFKDVSDSFAVPGVLRPHDWTEDGVVKGGTTRKYGYRSASAFMDVGEEDHYLPDQANGKDYICVDTFGLMGDHRVSGTRIRLNLHYKGEVIDVLTSNRVVKAKGWTYVAEDIIV